MSDQLSHGFSQNRQALLITLKTSPHFWQSTFVPQWHHTIVAVILAQTCSKFEIPCLKTVSSYSNFSLSILDSMMSAKTDKWTTLMHFQCISTMASQEICVIMSENLSALEQCPQCSYPSCKCLAETVSWILFVYLLSLLWKVMAWNHSHH